MPRRAGEQSGLAPWKRQPWDYSCTYGYKRLNVEVTALTGEELVPFFIGYEHGLYLLNDTD